MPDAHIESKAYIQLGDQRIPVQVEYAPVAGEMGDSPATFNRSLADLRNTTFQATGTLTEEGMRVLNDLLWDHTPAALYYPNMSEAPIQVSIDVSGVGEVLKQIRRVRSSLARLIAIADRSHRSKLRAYRAKLRQRRKHRTMFRRKKRGLS